MMRFNRKKLTVDDSNERIVHCTSMGGIWLYSPFMSEISRDALRDLDEHMVRAEKFINGEETIIAFLE